MITVGDFFRSRAPASRQVRADLRGRVLSSSMRICWKDPPRSPMWMLWDVEMSSYDSWISARQACLGEFMLALAPGGYLLLGPTGPVGPPADEFDAICGVCGVIYRRRPVSAAAIAMTSNPIVSSFVQLTPPVG